MVTLGLISQVPRKAELYQPLINSITLHYRVHLLSVKSLNNLSNRQFHMKMFVWLTYFFNWSWWTNRLFGLHTTFVYLALIQFLFVNGLSFYCLCLQQHNNQHVDLNNFLIFHCCYNNFLIFHCCHNNFLNGENNLVYNAKGPFPDGELNPSLLLGSLVSFPLDQEGFATWI